MACLKQSPLLNFTKAGGGVAGGAGGSMGASGGVPGGVGCTLVA